VPPAVPEAGRWLFVSRLPRHTGAVTTSPLLLQFRFSHYNEKARWALDYKHVAHHRRSFLPGLHIPPVLWKTGQRQVPALLDGDHVVAGSAAIVEYLERRQPEPPLYPADPADRERALEIQRWFDDEIGPTVRVSFFYQLLPHGRDVQGLFSGGASAPTRAVYAAIFPAIRAVMRRDMRITPERAAFGLTRAVEALDFVVKHAAPNGYLVGDRFSVADLAAAALLSPAALPPEFPYLPAEPYPAALTAWLGRWSDHPGTAWVRSMYARHRGESAERDSPS
jgi:glutathione S-transferase